MTKIKGKTILVTGAASGLGKLMIEQSEILQSGSNSFVLDVGQLSKANYVLTIEKDGEIGSFSFSKM